MCGISGAWGTRDQKTVESMMKHLRHRGPDDSGVYASAEGVLGHRRLSIMDPEDGKQPYRNEAESVTLVANGEIYNWRALRQDLQDKHTFATNADTEVALHLFEDGGADSVEKLEGMFALAFAKDGELTLARDPIGIKPLYYCEPDTTTGKTLRFASEMKALTDAGVAIHEVAPGTVYSATGSRTFYEVPNHQPEYSDDTDVPALIQDIRDTLTYAVERRLMSDVPLGAFLSGGLDSSIIAAIAKEKMGELHTFSVGVEGSPDLKAARFVSDYLGTVHHEYVFTLAEVKKALPEIIYGLESFDKDLVRSVVPTYFTARLAAEHVKVILTGEGADELFAGYTYYKDIADDAALHRELHRSITAMHNVNLQRVDRMTMAHSIEGRVPFLDTEMVDLAMRIPAEVKLHRQDGQKPIEKWILRRAFEDMLPHEIVWRDKAQFDEGSGSVDLLGQAIDDALGSFDAAAFRAARPDAKLRSDEEAYYYSIFEDVFERPDLMLPNVGRWEQ